MTDSAGVVRWSADYKPFGEVNITTSDITNNLRFPGQYYDAETGLNYNYYRDYHSGLGRYIEADPLGQNGDIGLYPYAKSNPLLYIDILGLKCCPKNEADYIRKRIKELEGRGDRTAGKIDFAVTECRIRKDPKTGNPKPTGITTEQSPLTDCQRECVMAHEGIHQKQCEALGPGMYIWKTLVSRSEMEEIPYAIELLCYKRLESKINEKCEDCK